MQLVDLVAQQLELVCCHKVDIVDISSANGCGSVGHLAHAGKAVELLALGVT